MEQHALESGMQSSASRLDATRMALEREMRLQLGLETDSRSRQVLQKARHFRWLLKERRFVRRVRRFERTNHG